METTLLLSKPPTPSLHSLCTVQTTFLRRPNNHHLTFTKRSSTPSINAAISRTKKETTVETVQTHLENCYLLAAINYKGLTVKQFQELRNSLPETTTLIVAKNTLVYKAIQNTPWEVIKPCMTGMNAWLFVHTEEIPVALKPYRTFQKEKKLEDKNDFTGACFEGKFYGPDEVNKLETLPSKAQVYGQLLGALNAPATNLVVTLQAPARDLVLTLKAYVKKLEEQQAQ
ncbi:large ribosomal subunit protein uL10c [Silene latifolia]|uniref:large ribosomal subunit protein uL10c n=1 Tax=Silene latifolia TaxID=37657 RepID=UPI003D783141